MKRVIGTLAAATLITTLAGPAAAGTGKAGPRKARILAKYDANANGVLDPAEKARLRADRKARRARLVQRYDRNRDGVLQPAERAAMRADRAGKRFDKLVARLDKNGDRALSVTEMRAAPAMQGKARRLARLARRFARTDRNADGVVTRGEFQKAAADRKARRGKRGTRGKRGAGKPASP